MESVEEMVDDFIEEMLKVQPEGPFNLMGWSYGGTLVHAVADELDRRGHEVAFAAILDSQPGGQGCSEIHAQQDGGTTGTSWRSSSASTSAPTTRLDFLDNMAKVLRQQHALMMEFESPVYRGDVLFFDAALKEEDETYAHLWRPVRPRRHRGARRGRHAPRDEHARPRWPRSSR